MKKVFLVLWLIIVAVMVGWVLVSVSDKTDVSNLSKEQLVEWITKDSLNSVIRTEDVRQQGRDINELQLKNYNIKLDVVGDYIKSASKKYKNVDEIEATEDDFNLIVTLFPEDVTTVFTDDSTLVEMKKVYDETLLELKKLYKTKKESK